MRRPLALMTVLLVSLASHAAAQAPAAAATRTYRIDPAASRMGFGVRHIVSTVDGSFGEFSGTITADPADVAATRAEITIRTASVDTDNAKRDAHLKTADFFDVEKHPDMRFVLTSVEPGDAGTAKAKGDLTLLGVTKPVDLAVTGVAFGADGSLAFQARGSIDRNDYGMTYDRANMIGDEVTLDLAVKAVGQ